MSRAYDVLKKSGVARLPVFERTFVPSQKDPAVVVEFPELGIESSPDLEREFERLYKNILLHGGEAIKTVLVCGPRGGEGTTTVSLNLAAYVAAKRDIPVLLVEANFAESMFLGDDDGRVSEGFSGFLLGQGSLRNYVRATTVPNLDLIPAGETNHRKPTRWSLSQIERVIQECLTGYGFIVFDSPPADDPITITLAGSVDGMVIVLSPTTSVKQTLAARNTFQRVGGKILGIVINRCNR
jgi:Mrp family chromosome partitioning ATPase